MPSVTTVRKTGADEFLNSENDKNDYDWLLTPPDTPLFPSLETESQKTVMNPNGAHKPHPTAVKSTDVFCYYEDGCSYVLISYNVFDDKIWMLVQDKAGCGYGWP
ncbi:hypothetical protein SSX86_023766 [Deinandra increscens subsp. villosa]|uniref:Uncharacterized protein n=1 Tax=Deinandra increscens subsp. villosa TaxID=3103831 RepID=A0AAP0GQ47_9ASTR